MAEKLDYTIRSTITTTRLRAWIGGMLMVISAVGCIWTIGAHLPPPNYILPPVLTFEMGLELLYGIIVFITGAGLALVPSGLE